MRDICTDNRFEVIERYKQKLIEDTNIEQSPKEMEVIDNILFRFWRMGWLEALETEAIPVEWIRKYTEENRLYQSDDFDLYISDMIADWAEEKEE